MQETKALFGTTVSEGRFIMVAGNEGGRERKREGRKKGRRGRQITPTVFSPFLALFEGPPSMMGCWLLTFNLFFLLI